MFKNPGRYVTTVLGQSQHFFFVGSKNTVNLLLCVCCDHGNTAIGEHMYITDNRVVTLGCHNSRTCIGTGLRLNNGILLIYSKEIRIQILIKGISHTLGFRHITVYIQIFHSHTDSLLGGIGKFFIQSLLCFGKGNNTDQNHKPDRNQETNKNLTTDLNFHF